jgi:MFS transporter, NNP family, nitrate/nitrite transporter
MLGGLGGFFLPPLFAYTKEWTGFPTSTFFVLFVLTAMRRLDALDRRPHAAHPESRALRAARLEGQEHRQRGPGSPPG